MAKIDLRDIHYSPLRDRIPNGTRRTEIPPLSSPAQSPSLPPAAPAHISTSFAERNNLNIRMHSSRMTRLTNAFSKKLENHACAMALHFLYYNFVCVHQTLKVSPAMARWRDQAPLGDQ
jgi:hypothetical protein